MVYEILTGEQPESFSSQYMERGHELEPLAIEYYENERFATVLPGGFYEYDEYTGASPDGRIDGENGIVEVKSPSFNTMIEYLEREKLPSEYRWQVQGQLFVTGADFCDFIAFHPKLRPMILRVLPDKEMIGTIKVELAEAINTVKSKLNVLSKYRI